MRESRFDGLETSDMIAQLRQTADYILDMSIPKKLLYRIGALEGTLAHCCLAAANRIDALHNRMNETTHESDELQKQLNGAFDVIRGLTAQRDRMMQGLSYIAQSEKWGKGTALRRSISDLQDEAAEALKQAGVN